MAEMVGFLKRKVNSWGGQVLGSCGGLAHLMWVLAGSPDFAVHLCAVVATILDVSSANRK